MNDGSLEDRLRHALREPVATDRVDADGVLRDVHRGARRHRTGRLVAGGAAVAMVTAGGFALVSNTLLGDQRSPMADSVTARNPTAQVASSATGASPSSDPLSTVSGTAAPSRASQQIPVSLTATGNDYQWVLAAADDGSCATSQCAVVYSTSDAGLSPWSGPSRLGVSVSADGPQAGTVQEVRFARADPANQADGWAFGGALLSSHDSGSTWTPVALPVQGVVTHLEAWGDDVYAAVDGPAPTLLRSPVGTDDFRVVPVPGGVGHVSAIAVAKDIAAFIDTSATTPNRVMVSTDGARSWVSVSPCGGQSAEQLSTVEGALWVVCGSGAATTASVTTDGVHWSTTSTPSHPFTLAARTPDTALAVSDGSVELLQTGAAPVTISRPPVQDVVFAGFTNPDAGYVIDADGRMWRTSDGGAFWYQYAVHL